jgi:type IV secretory pathway VirJ component
MIKKLLFTTKCFSLLAVVILTSTFANASTTDTLKYGSFGRIVIYKPATVANAVVLFVSGDNGWSNGVVEIAKNIVAQGGIVACIDFRQYQKGLRKEKSKCFYPAGDLEELSMMLQKKYKLKQYFKPILIGYTAGATLVYGALAQAPANTFKGAMALAFSPEIKITKPFCSGSGLKQHALKAGYAYYLEPFDKLTAPFIILHGAKDLVCPLASSQQFIKSVNTGKLVELPEVGHEFAVTTAWLPQFVEEYKKVMTAPSYAEQKTAQNPLLQSQKLDPLSGDFPVIPIPSAIKDSSPLVFLISGDGGWTSFDNSLGEALAAKGMPVVGLDAQKYFWEVKTPEQTAAEVSKAIQHFMQQWNKQTFVLAGYSFGAGVVPFIADRLPASLKKQLESIFCLSPDETADFEIHISDMLNFGTADDQLRVIDEIRKLRQFHPVCIFGVSEDTKLRERFGTAGAVIITVPGNHHYNDNPSAAADAMVNEIKKNTPN